MFLPTEVLDKMRVVIADANQVVRTWVRSQLSQAGVKHVTMAGSSADLLRQCSAVTPDVVLCDHNFGEKQDGLRVLEELRLNHILPLGSVFLLVTGDNVRRRVVAAAEFAPDDYLLKPFTSGQLGERLVRAVRKKQALKPVYEQMEVRNLEGVIAECDKVLSDLPVYSMDALRIRAEALIALGRLDEATEIYKAVMARNTVPWARIGYAIVLRERGEIAEAARQAAEINEEFPEFMGVYDFLGELHEQAGELDEARTYYERADSIAPDNLRRLRALGEIYLESGDPERAAMMMRRVVERTEGTSLANADDHLTLIKSLIDLPDAAEALNRRIEELKPLLGGNDTADMMADVIKARMLAQQGDENGAREAIDRALAAHARLTQPPGFATHELAEACYATGKDEAASELVNSLETAGTSVANRLKRQHGRSARERAQQAAAELAAETAAGPDLDQVDEELSRLAELIRKLEPEWLDELAQEARNILIDVFTLAPRERRVIDAHIQYNRVAQKHGHDRHKPTARAS
ncbi:tetratricopeptide repeat protein [Methyloversatilis thermotolerans]|uniref:tetratricopeptide repeat protein n=1 Tax=Methyloversatilis thermotolerans TaxID=1346290 RepID=UPI00036D3AE4|nr:response regulator [Methyloversatilis thermotolerans]